MVIGDGKMGGMGQELGTDIFHLVSSLTPIINVDLLIKNEKGETLLAWRDDDHTGKGWHIPGGVIRLHETIEERIKKTSRDEIGIVVDYNLTPLDVQEIIVPAKKIRSHFISILYECFLSSKYEINKNKSKNDAGYLWWFEKGHPRKNLLSYHEIYRKYL